MIGGNHGQEGEESTEGQKDGEEVFARSIDGLDEASPEHLLDQGELPVVSGERLLASIAAKRRFLPHSRTDTSSNGQVENLLRATRFGPARYPTATGGSTLTRRKP
jgi:hypothetical protein